MNLDKARRFEGALRVAAVVLGLAAPGCGTLDLTDLPPPVITETASAKSSESRVLFVLFDGTRNEPSSGTNVHLMKQLIEASRLPARLLYLEGVGSIADPPLLGPALGMGMEARIDAGYRFLSREYRAGDRIVILGFSRGAHQARALAGLISYVGLLDPEGVARANAVIDAVKDYTDDGTATLWKTFPAGHPRLEEVEQRLRVRLRPASITFLGVWDTVPGSWFKAYGTCREQADGRQGDRYKTGSYPRIAHIAHAVALDEKRTRFSPLLLCPAIDASTTRVKEVWFAGAHADVGGGYGPARPSQARISFAWMALELSEALGEPLEVPTHGAADEQATLHWSMGDRPGNLGSHCADRIVPPSAVLHASVDPLRRAGTVALVMHGQPTNEAYPLRCARLASQ